MIVWSPQAVQSAQAKRTKGTEGAGEGLEGVGENESLAEGIAEERAEGLVVGEEDIIIEGLVVGSGVGTFMGVLDGE